MALTIKVCDERFSNLSKRFDSNYALLIDELGDILFWIKSVPIPGISLNSELVPHEDHNIPLAGNVFDYGNDLPVSFYLDENLYVLKYLYEWLIGWKNNSDFIGKKEKQVSLLLFDNNSSRVNCIINFEDMFIDKIEGGDLNNKGKDNISLTCSFKYTKWEPEFRY